MLKWQQWQQERLSIYAWWARRFVWDGNLVLLIPTCVTLDYCNVLYLGRHLETI